MERLLAVLFLAAGAISTTAGLALFSTNANANSNAGEQVDNFVLLDHTGKAQELYYQSDANAVVILVQDNNCPAVHEALATFDALQSNYQSRGVRFWMLNLQDDRASIASEAAARGIQTPILEDSTQIIGESLGVTHAGEVLVLDSSHWRIASRGTVDTTAEVLDQLLAGAPVTAADGKGVSEALDCQIDYTSRDLDHAAISYSETIAPILKENCAYCHVEGGIGPWAMTDYNMVRGFAPMIREVVRTKRMPPWHADPHIGQWDSDRSLSNTEVQTLVHWIEAGAPRGPGPDPLLEVLPLSSAWPLGKPDLVVAIPGFEVPASGVVDYQFPYVKNELDHGVWVTAATVLPGDRSVVHHVLAGTVEGEQPPGREDSVMDNYIIGYAPGSESYEMPPGTGVYIAPGGYFTFQLHYTPVGRMAVDNSRMGLYLSDAPPINFLRNTVVVSPDLNIPPNTPHHEEAAYYQFEHDAIIHTLFPHSHYRGKSSSFEVQYPDGRLETVLSVPNYDFNWQRGYNPIEPIELPAGSRLIHRTVYDNSKGNPANPDPEQTVHWGLQSWEEMLYGAVSFSWVDETTEHPIHDKQRSSVTQFIGFLDKNMDGKVSWRELPDRMKKQLVQGFKAVDTNGDGGLDIDEFLKLRNRRQGDKTQPDQTGD
jgi:hypothetical protein